MSTTPVNRPPLSFWQIWNMSFGFFGIQFGWGLQMANMSAIYQYLGANPEDIPLLWIAAPVTGLLVQPIIGYFSDRTWTRLGRRRPYFLVGAILASLALVAMPNSSTLWMAAGLLWILDASVNISMEPFRAFVGDLLPPKQRKMGFSMQSLLIGLGAVLSSGMPWVLSNVFGLSGAKAGDSAIPLSVHISFYTGAVLFFAAVLYTVLTTKEYPPTEEELAEQRAARGGAMTPFIEIFQGIREMPTVMKQLAIPQFFTWFGLFCMWIYFAPAVAEGIFGAETGTPLFQQGVEWAGVCFMIYNGVAFLFAFGLLALSRKHKARTIHIGCLLVGAVGLLSCAIMPNQYLLILSMVGVGVAWASVLAMPYAILANGLPSNKMGFYMGVFNFFIVLPQIVASAALGLILRYALGGHPMNAIILGGAAWVIAAITMRFVTDDEGEMATA